MTDSIRKRAERERRKAAGEKRVEAWLTDRDASWLRQMADQMDETLSQAVTWCIDEARRGEQK